MASSMALLQEEQKCSIAESEYGPQEDAEGYCAGGYHPVESGDIFVDRYRVVRKLGWGNFSTVWLCFDVKRCQYVAIKITKSIYSKSANNEIIFLETVRDTDPSDPRREKIIHMLDSFKLKGVNGTHVCAVMEILGSNLYELCTNSWYTGIPISNVKSIIRQLLQALEYLHFRCGIIHTDIKPENVLQSVNYKQIEDLVRTTVQWHKLGIEMPPGAVSNVLSDAASNSSTRKIPGNLDVFFGLSTLPGVSSPKKAAVYPDPSKDVCDINIKLGDLGNCCFLGNKYPSKIQTLQYRCIEAIVGTDDFGTAVDIWSVACLAFELATGYYLFSPKSDSDYNRTEHHLALMISHLGPIPTRIATSGRDSPNLFDIRGRFKKSDMIIPNPLAKILVKWFGWKEKDANEFAKFLLPMLNFDPRKRASATECLKHPWLNS